MRFYPKNRVRLALMPLAAAAILFSSTSLLHAQATSRAEEIRQLRVDKQARIWPERTSGIVKQVNGFAERGLLEGAKSGKGTNGFQFVLGGMRSGNGTSFGIGYRRVDIWRERIGFRATARGMIQQAFMFDLEIDIVYGSQPIKSFGEFFQFKYGLVYIHGVEG